MKNIWSGDGGPAQRSLTGEQSTSFLKKLDDLGNLFGHLIRLESKTQQMLVPKYAGLHRTAKNPCCFLPPSDALDVARITLLKSYHKNICGKIIK